MSGGLELPEELTLPIALDAFAAVIGDDEQLRKLVDLLTPAGGVVQRIESGRELEGVVLRASRVVAGTCLGFLSHPAVRDLEFDLCILDEVSKATATETLVPLSRSKRWVLVGDPNQLPPMQEEVLDDPDLMHRHDLNRADVEQTLFQRLLDHAPQAARHRLTHQYRMVPGIGDLVSECFYDGQLTSMSTRTLPGLDVLYKPVTWLDTATMADRFEKRDGTSLVNYCEARAIRRAITSLRAAVDRGVIKTLDGQPLRVLVLTAYAKQMAQLRHAAAGAKLQNLEIEVNTVDAVQGREADITFYSVVRSDQQRQLGFLGPLHWRRINVALSRSRYGLVIVGDAPFCESTPGPLSTVLTHIRRNGDTSRRFAAEDVGFDAELRGRGQDGSSAPAWPATSRPHAYAREAAVSRHPVTVDIGRSRWSCPSEPTAGCLTDGPWKTATGRLHTAHSPSSRGNRPAHRRLNGLSTVPGVDSVAWGRHPSNVGRASVKQRVNDGRIWTPPWRLKTDPPCVVDLV